jgi:hypothetical protein
LALGADGAVANCASAAEWIELLRDGTKLRALARSQPLQRHRDLFARGRVEPRFAEYLTNLCSSPGRSMR